VWRTFKQAISYLLRFPKDWQYKEGDEIWEDVKLRNSTLADKSKAHIKFFQTKYNTLDPNVISNLRMYELRATNYSKLTGELIASTLLIFGLIFAMIWIGIKVYASSPVDDPKSAHDNEITVLQDEVVKLRDGMAGLETLRTQMLDSYQKQQAQLSVLETSELELQKKINILDSKTKRLSKTHRNSRSVQ
jgi:hypothetical protein